MLNEKKLDDKMVQVIGKGRIFERQNREYIYDLHMLHSEIRVV